MIIGASNLGKRFNREWIFNGLTLEFQKGIIYAITGPNGSGKSTLMQVLWGQVPASAGEIQYHFDGKTIPMEESFQFVSIAAPYMDLLEEYTLTEHVQFHFKFKKPIQGMNHEALLKKMQLEAYSNKPIKQFSSGMKQRLKLGLAMFSDCPILFLDEPTTNLDEASARWYLSNLLEIRAKRLVFIATNQPSDYPENSVIINLNDLKMVTKAKETRIQTS